VSWHLHEGDCLEVMPRLPDKSVDMILCDLPYGTTSCKWDVVLPFDQLWAQWKRVLKHKGSVLLFGSQPFTTALINSNPAWFRYEWVWEKVNTTGFQLAKKMPLKKHENICVFYEHLPTYNPQGLIAYGKVNRRGRAGNGGHLANECNRYIQEYTNYPTSLLRFGYDNNKYHPTQKPIGLVEYLIRTYTNPGATVLDNCAGSGTTLLAAERCGRNSIGIERDPNYCRVIRERMAQLEATA
jgi:site-specific DNA-methyltransferase (adenine-specific)